MTRKDSGARHSASSVQIEGLLAARHIDYRFEANFAVDCIIQAEGHQVRLIEHRAPPDIVTRYAEQMKAGAVFPAIVVNERGELIDGNTRTHAAVKAGRSTISAYICRDLTPLQARSLSVELNQANGLAMNQEELHGYVRSAIREGQRLDARTCIRITGVRPSTLERWKAQAQFEQRAERCGIYGVDLAGLSDGVQAALNAIRLTPVLIEATSLAAAARMSTSAVRKLVMKINTATSESEALAVVKAEWESRAEDIRSIASGFTARRRVGKRSTMHVIALLKLKVDDLLEVAPEKRAETVARLRCLRDHVDEALASATARWGPDEGKAEGIAADAKPEVWVQGGGRG